MNAAMKFDLTKSEIECSSNIDEHWNLFHKAIGILEERIKLQDFSEFNDEEREILEETFIKMEGAK